MVETWGGGISLGGIYRSEVYQPGEILSTKDISDIDGPFGEAGFVYASFIAFEASLNLGYQYGAMYGDYAENTDTILSFVTPGPYVDIGWTTVNPIDSAEVYSDMPRWVYNIYNRRDIINFKQE
jgi:hypothetical protein